MASDAVIARAYTLFRPRLLLAPGRHQRSRCDRRPDRGTRRSEHRASALPLARPSRPTHRVTLQKLQSIDFNQASDFAALKSSFQQLGREIPSAVLQRDAVVQTELETAQAEVAALEKQLQEYVS